MHFHSLAVLRIPEIQEDAEENARIEKELAEMEQMEDQGPQNIMRSIMIRELRGLLNSFSREVYRLIQDLMHPYGSESEDCYEFIDQKSDVQSGYENRSCDCVRLPDGRIVSLYDRSVWGKFVIKDGQVFQKKAGPLQHPMRTHKAKKMKALPDYPFKKLYKTMHEYAIDYCNYEYDEATQGYGYYCNPNAMWDWYQIGGRWPVTFLVKDTCTEYSFGERSWGNDDEDFPCPEGYMWVSAARKKDIEWDVMKQWYLEQAKKRFTALESMFVTGLMKPEKYMQVKEGCVYSFMDLIYKIGEVEEEYLTRIGVKDERKYPVSFCDLIDEDDWITQGNEYLSPQHADQPALTWDDAIQQFIDDLDDDDVLVSVDYHM